MIDPHEKQICCPIPQSHLQSISAVSKMPLVLTFTEMDNDQPAFNLLSQQATYAYLKMIGDDLQARYQNVHNKDNVIGPMFQSIVQSNRTLQKRLNLDFLPCLMIIVCRWLRNAGSSYLPVQ